MTRASREDMVVLSMSLNALLAPAHPLADTRDPPNPQQVLRKLKHWRSSERRRHRSALRR